MPITPSLRVKADLPDRQIDLQFSGAFRIGRLSQCEVCILDTYVSREHLEVFPDAGVGGWRVRDLGSANGIFVGGQRVDGCLVQSAVSIRLGSGGPFLTLEPVPVPPPDLEAYVQRYFDAPGSQAGGDHTQMIRKAFLQVQKKQKRKYGGVFAALGVVAAVLGGYAFWIHNQTKDQIGLARTLFYGIKSLEIDVAGLEKLVDGNDQARQRIRDMNRRREEMSRDYDRFLTAIHASDAKVSPRERLIVRVARIFGECELEMPRDFVHEVDTYIAKWKSSDRLAKAIHTAVAKHYVPVIASALLARQLPAQFFYLALQESNFDPYISGPPTRSGIAKGMWQFIPQTAKEYGLHIGPLAEIRGPDTLDDRHDWEKSTRAAARYLKDLYTTEAQASGFLVMACYNWGEVQVLPLVRSLPNNPRDRNFWRLLAVHRDKLPQETYDYVFSIISAAAIGEDPRLFGFDFDNPLANLPPQ